MKGKFFGGSLDGTESDGDLYGRRYIVPGRVNGRMHQETYVRAGRDETHLYFRFEKLEDVHDQHVAAMQKFNEDTMRRVLGEDDE